jgi:hypothetical protein
LNLQTNSTFAGLRTFISSTEYKNRERSLISEKSINNEIFITTVIAAGNDFFNILIKNLPFTIFLFGSKASINAGIPIVIVLTKLSCIG